MAQPNSEIKTRRRDAYPVAFKNGSSETAPAYAIMQVDTVEGVPIDQAQLVTIKKPDSTDGQYLVNGPLAVRAGKQGRCRLNGPMTMAFTGSAPALGDTVGPSAGSWQVSTAGSGYDVLGGAEGGVVLCSRAGGSGNISATMMVLTENIAAATGDTASITPTSGEAQIYTTDPTTKVRTPTPATTTTVYNYDVCQSYSERQQVWVVTGAGGVPEIISAACCTLAAG